MKFIEPLDEAAMVMAWAEMERDSPVRQEAIENIIGGRLLTQDVANEVLAKTRSWPTGGIFTGLPTLNWSRATITIGELEGWALLYYRTFGEITQGSFLVRDGAANVHDVQAGEELNQRVLNVEAAIRNGKAVPPLIAVSSPDLDRPNIIEGNTRALALSRSQESESEIQVILGNGPSLAGWGFLPQR